MANFINPFKRQKEVRPLPHSVCPANMTNRTSMRIGDVVPVYLCEAMQGDTWRAKVTDALTRFMTMEKPVMNDFEVVLASYYVPYHALDRLTNSDWLKKNWSKLKHSDSGSSFTASEFMSYKPLNMREFFNPALNDADRVKPLMLTTDNIDIFNFSGSLYDHIGYTNPDGIGSRVFTNYVFDFDSSSYVGVDSDSLENLATKFTVEYGDWGKTVVPLFKSVEGSYDLSFITWLYFYLSNYDMPSRQTILAQVNEGMGAFVTEATHGFGMTSELSKFTKLSLNKLIEIYITWFNGREYKGVRASNDPESVIPTLGYLRIYGDYFLNDLYNSHEVFFDIISGIYAYLSVDGGTVENAVERVCIGSGSGNFSPRDRWFFTDYLAKGKCFPVLWQTDYFTSMLPKITVDTSVGAEPVIVGGETMPELFAKRLLARFNNFIARMGMDSRINRAALYGHNSKDESLERSQVIGVSTLTVNITAITQNSATADSGAIGDMAGFAYTSQSTHDTWEWTADENGLIYVLAWIRPRNVAYAGSTRRLFFKSEYLDYLLPDYAGVGYQSVRASEMRPFAPANTHLGYQERYFEYLMIPNAVSGAFRDIAKQYSVDRLSPVISTADGASSKWLYITENDDIQRIFMDTVTDPILAEIHIEGSISRTVPATIRTEY